MKQLLSLALVLLALPTLVSVTTLSSCSSGGGGGGGIGVFVVQNTTHGVATNTPVLVNERFLAYLASEGSTGAGGTDMNGDTDILDSIVVVVNMVTGVTTNLGVAVASGLVAADTLAWTDTNVTSTSLLYMVVSEADDMTDWNGDLDMTDRVLLSWTSGTGAPVFVDEVSAGPGVKMIAMEDKLFYTTPVVPTMALETNLNLVLGAAPVFPLPMFTNHAAVDGLTVHLMGQDEGLISLYFDEALDGELNGDADATDSSILGLLDGTAGAAGCVLSTSLAIAGPSGLPFRASSLGASDWLVGFLVDEAAQGINFNDPLHADLGGAGWAAPQCMGKEDADMTDGVLHWLDFSDFVADQVVGRALNTGVVGEERIAIVGNFLGTKSSEVDAGGCDLNDDMDFVDPIFRWVEAVSPPRPVTDMTKLLAIGDTPGGTHGFAELSGRFVIVVDEAADGRSLYDGDMATDNLLVGSHDPLLPGTGFEFDHTPGGGADPAGATWMSEAPDRTRLLLAFPEEINGVDINGDAVADDSVLTFPFFNGPADINFPGFGIGLEETNAGITLIGVLAFFRASESAGGDDFNGDGDGVDTVLFRMNSNGGTPVAMATHNILTRPSVFFDPDIVTHAGAALITQESMQGPAGTDLNGDGDATDHVVRFFRL